MDILAFVLIATIALSILQSVFGIGDDELDKKGKTRSSRRRG